MLIRLVSDGKFQTCLEIDGKLVSENVTAIWFEQDTKKTGHDNINVKIRFSDDSTWDSHSGAPFPDVPKEKRLTTIRAATWRLKKGFPMSVSLCRFMQMLKREYLALRYPLKSDSA